MMTPAELAAELRTSERTISRMVIDGCPSMLVGRRRRFDLAAVTAWITERAAPCPSAKTLMAAGTPRSASNVAACRVKAFVRQRRPSPPMEQAATGSTCRSRLYTTIYTTLGAVALALSQAACGGGGAEEEDGAQHNPPVNCEKAPEACK